MRGFDGPRGDRDPYGPPFARPSPIVVGGRLVGVVVVPPQPPFGFLLGRYAPLLALVAGVVLVVGTVLTSVLIFGPARRRLRDLEMAARRFGAGDLTARAPERGGDEIAAVALAFNSHGQGPVGSRRRAGRVRPRPPSAAGRRLARVDDTGDRNARLPRNARDAGADAGRRDANPLSENHRRRDRQARSADRRSPGTRPPRRRRRDVEDLQRRRRRSLRPGEGAARTRLCRRRAFPWKRLSRPAQRRSPGIRIGSSRRCRTWRQMRFVMRRAEPRSGCPRGCSGARARSSLQSLPRRPSTVLGTALSTSKGRSSQGAARAKAGGPRSCSPSRTKARALLRNTCPTSSTASTRLTRRAPASPAEAVWDCRSSKRLSSAREDV